MAEPEAEPAAPDLDLPWLEEVDPARARRPGSALALSGPGLATAVVVGLIGVLVAAGILYLALKPGGARTEGYPTEVPLPPVATASASPSATPSATPTPHGTRHHPAAAPQPEASAVAGPGEGASRHRGAQAEATAPVATSGEGASRHRGRPVETAQAAPRTAKRQAGEAAARPAPEHVSSRPLPGQTIQLAAFPRPAQADAYWRKVTRRHAALGRLRHQIVRAEVRGRTVYRLRAAGDGAHALCERLRGSGTACMIVGH